MPKLTSGGLDKRYDQGTECPIEVKSGLYCENVAWPDAPFPICRHHAVKLYIEMRGIHNDAIVDARGVELPLDPTIDPNYLNLEKQKANAEDYAAACVVYYVRIGDKIKIGFTGNLTQRMKSLRADKANVLAVEPGGRELEARRHKQFSRLRAGRREDFQPTFALIQHIDSIRERYGEPKF